MGIRRAAAHAAIVTGVQLVLALALAGDVSAAGARFSAVRAHLATTPSRPVVSAARAASSRAPGRGAAHGSRDERGPGRLGGDVATADPGAFGGPTPDARSRRRAPDSCAKAGPAGRARAAGFRANGDVHAADVALAQALFHDAHAPPPRSSIEAVLHLS